MILIADGGSTKVDWRLIKNGKETASIVTNGANPYFRTPGDIESELKELLLPVVGESSLDTVFFYGSGCGHSGTKQMLYNALVNALPARRIEIESDLLAAARGLCGTGPGIVGILGTGSNSGYYDGGRIIENVSPLGYILGDEGSGAVLGRLFIGACLKNQLTAGIKEELLDRYKLTPAIILDKVYKHSLPNRFLAAFCPFILEYATDESVNRLLHTAFRDYFERNIRQYQTEGIDICLTGSVAFHFQKTIHEVAAGMNLTIAKVVQSPMDGLIQYHQ